MQEAWTSLAIALAMAFTTHRGLRDPAFAARLGYDPVLVAQSGQWTRYFTCAFVHPSWWSYAANALMLFWFGGLIEHALGPGPLLAVYGISLGAGNWLHQRLGGGHLATFVGSGAGTSGVFFCSLLLFPGLRVFGLPTWLFAALYFLLALNRPQIGGVSLFAIRIADLFGAAMGLMAGLAIQPGVVVAHPVHAVYLIALTTAFLWYQRRNPLNLPFREVVTLPRRRVPGAPRRPAGAETASPEEVDRLLDKISQEGLQSLTARERATLERASRERRS
jgi:membrane associated rhomboid family serine protease